MAGRWVRVGDSGPQPGATVRQTCEGPACMPAKHLKGGPLGEHLMAVNPDTHSERVVASDNA
ncbi:MAG: hypothetical protein ACPGU1_21325 [Myxococcota bacterium]